MKTIVLIISLLWWSNWITQAQCDKTLVQKASEQMGKEGVLVRNFKVKLKEGDKRNPSPSSRFSVLMQKDISYRFCIVGATENAESAVLQLYDRSNLLGSTYDFDKTYNAGNFSYQCPRTGDYQVIVTMRNGKAGCAAGIMSMVVDSAFLSSRNQTEEEKDGEEDNILYSGIKNQLEVLTDSLGEGKFDLTIDNGVITYKRGYYYADIDKGNAAKITVKRIGNDGKVLEELVREYKVVPLPAPKVRLGKYKSDFINSFDLTSINRLEVIPAVYRIVQFYISYSQDPFSGFRSNDEYLTYDQRNFLQNLGSHNRFYIHDIQVENPDGTVVTIGTMEYFLR